MINMGDIYSCEGHFSKEPLNFGFSIFAPISSEPKSASFFFLQPLLTGKVFASLGVLIAAQLFIFLAERLFGLESMTFQKGSGMPTGQTKRMSLRDFQDHLASVSRGNDQSPSDPVVSGTLETPEIPIVFALSVWGDFESIPYGPTVFILLPLFTLPNARGALPLLILELLSTIFVRSVVPPQTTGAKALQE